MYCIYTHTYIYIYTIMINEYYNFILDLIRFRKHQTSSKQVKGKDHVGSRIHYIYIHWVCKSLISLSIAAVFLVRSHRPYAKAGGWTEGAVSLGAMAEQWTIKVKIVSGLGLIPAHALLYFFCVVLNYGQLSAKIQSKASVLAFICTHAPTSSHDAKPWFVVCRHGQRSHQQQERHQVETWWWPHPADRGSRAPKLQSGNALRRPVGGVSYDITILYYFVYALFQGAKFTTRTWTYTLEFSWTYY